MSDSIQFPTERDMDLQLFNRDDSFNQLFNPEAYDGWVVISPLLIIGAAIVTILCVAKIVSPIVAFGVSCAVGGVVVLTSPLVILHLYFFYRYRNTSLKAEELKEKLLCAIQGKDPSRSQKAQQLARAYRIAL